jgi:hypothetical protein
MQTEVNCRQNETSKYQTSKKQRGQMSDRKLYLTLKIIVATMTCELCIGSEFGKGWYIT